MFRRRHQDAGINAALALPAPHRNTVQRKLLLWTLVMVVAPMLAGGWWLSRVTRHLLQQQQADTAVLVSQTMASALADRLTLHAAHHGQIGASIAPMLESLERDQRLAFVVVTDANMTPLYQYAVNAEGWQAAREMIHDISPGAMHMDQPLFVPDHQGLVLIKVPIWSEPLPAHMQGNRPRLRGFFMLAMRDDLMATALDQLHYSHVMVTCVMCLLSLPLVILAVRRWCAPLRALLEATAQIAAGKNPAPIPVTSRDELGALSSSFNQMSRKLHVAREELQRANEVLEQKVVNRTAELERLNRKLESEIHDKNEFIRAISHDLGAPLRNINGITSVLLLKYRQQLNEDTLTKLQRISANAKVQAELISDLLELSRIRSRPAKRELVDLNELLAQLRENLAFDLEKARIELIVQPDLPVIIAERTRMRQVIQNLLDNAIKYMLDATTREIRVSCETQEHWWHLSVSDTGCGIAQQDLPHVFDLFRRATHSGSHLVQGRGVGLSTVKTIVEHYGGRIWVQSTLGQGSTFHITLDRRHQRTKTTYDEPQPITSS
jgi:signal transduction histidine kinase